MVRYENDCVDCPQGCIDCGRKRTPHYYCDNPKCGDEATLYEYESEQLCADCLLSKFKVVEGSDC